MTGFLGENFLLDTPQAERLYHDTAARLPIIDYHNHLDPRAILEDRSWSSIGEIWLEGDHYKWRAMRWNGIDEDRITGAAGFRDKFLAFAETMPHCIGNPLYHWSHLELRRYFDWGGVFGPKTADEVWEAANEKLAQPSHSARGLLRQLNVRFVGTTDDPCDDLAAHRALSQDADMGFAVAPSFRPDAAFKIANNGFGAYIERLSDISGVEVTGFDTLIEALLQRLDHFVANGCKASDHGLDTLASFVVRPAGELDQLLDRARNGAIVTLQDAADFQGAVLIQLGRAYAARDLVMQFHIGALRNSNSRLYGELGPDIGCDSISDAPIATPLNALLDAIQQSGGLPRTILYGLDPSRNEVIVTTAGNFQDGSVPGKVQAGTAWWFNDQLDGMERQMTQLAQMGLLSCFLGMLTDSRSFLSFPRHEYFRRLLCRMIGRWMSEGHIPDDLQLTTSLVRRVCHDNAHSWFMDASR
ncbi:glucuronate isomerase [Ruegeria sp. Ofav3-42]|uniref:glucuronate isomerase n=1 Tax=Ruegeria sp. Ofav3-42 TaxID=2917759 RepID=UPI001EF47516|nr:glucuronate isomerase [Ruegeria sp. Ofav3-42]MCG7521448.1 glucuronate isomerase [Ruegeria sp. Ofav3-42]